MIKNLTRKKSAHWLSISRLWLVWLCAVTTCIGQTVLEDPPNDNFELFEGWPVFGCWDIAQISGGVRASNLYLSQPSIMRVEPVAWLSRSASIRTRIPKRVSRSPWKPNRQ